MSRHNEQCFTDGAGCEGYPYCPAAPQPESGDENTRLAKWCDDLADAFQRMGIGREGDGNLRRVAEILRSRPAVSGPDPKRVEEVLASDERVKITAPHCDSVQVGDSSPSSAPHCPKCGSYQLACRKRGCTWEIPTMNALVCARCHHLAHSEACSWCSCSAPHQGCSHVGCDRPMPHEHQTSGPHQGSEFLAEVEARREKMMPGYREKLDEWLK